MNYFANSYEEASSLSFLVEKMNIPFIKIAIFNPIKLNYRGGRSMVQKRGLSMVQKGGLSMVQLSVFQQTFFGKGAPRWYNEIFKQISTLRC